MRSIIILCLALILSLTCTTGLWAADETQYNVGIMVVKQKNLAESLRQRILKGENFQELAKANSIGPNARRGGALGMVPASKLRNEYRQALADLKVGQISRVIAVEEGYTILTLLPPASAQVPGSPSQGRPIPAGQPVPSTSMAASPGTTRFMVEPATAEAVNVSLLTEVLNGLEFMQKNDLKRAEEAFKRALTLEPADDSSQLLLGMVQESLAGKYHPRVMVAIADAFTNMLQGEEQSAYDKFTAISQQNPKLWQVKLMAGTLLLQGGDPDQALAVLQEVVKLNPNYANTYLVIGNAYYFQLKGQAAEAAYVKAINLKPDLADGHYFLGRLYMGYGDTEFAEQEYRRAIALDPSMYDAYNDLGTIYMSANRRDEAEQCFNQALKANPGLVPAMVNLGILYGTQQQWDKAQAQLEHAVAIRVVMPPANFNLGLIYIQQRKWTQAEEQIKLAADNGYSVPEEIYKMLKERRTN